ncbi:MAG: ABC transporter ATP-binding protein, partial [Ignisphaera sp.]
KNITMTFSIRKGLKKLYFNAVDNISIDVNEGEVVGLIGESGSGKTTLGKITLDLLKPTKGEVYFQGKNIRKMNKQEYKKYRINAQYIPQDPYASLNPYKRVVDILSDIVSYHMPKLTNDQVVDLVSKTMERVGLSPPEKYYEKYPFQLSGGERQRLSIARAIILNPRYVVADEPVTMLDASLKAGIMSTLANLIEEMNSSLLFITHEISLLQFFGEKTRVIIMYLGKFVEEAPLSKIINNAAHPYTQALIAAIPVPDPKARETRKIILKGPQPSPVNKPPGCVLSNRCPFAMDICRKEQPPAAEIDRNHYVYCWLYSKK